MNFDQQGMPPPPFHVSAFDEYDDNPVVQFDVGPDDSFLTSQGQQVKQKAKKGINTIPGMKKGTGPTFNSPMDGSNAKSISTDRQDFVEVQYKGYTIKKAEPLEGQQANWGRVVTIPLPFPNAILAEQSKKIRKETKTDQLTAYTALKGEQCTVVNRIIDNLQREEKSKNAVWILDSVRKHKEMVKISWMREEQRTYKIQIILKRQDKNALKPGQKPITSKPKVYQNGEVVDLSEPAFQQKEKSIQTLKYNQPQTNANIKVPKVKNVPRQQDHHDQHLGFQDVHFPPQQQQWQDPVPFHGEPMMSGGLQDSFNDVGNFPLPKNVVKDPQLPRGNHSKQQQPNPFLPPDISMGPPPGIPPAAPMPPGAMHIDDWTQPRGNIAMSQPKFEAQGHLPPLRNGFDDNPFKPNDNVYNPAGYDLPLDLLSNQFAHPLPQTRSHTPGPMYSSRDPSRDRHRDASQGRYHEAGHDLEHRQLRKDDKATRRNSKLLQRKVDNLDDKMEQLHEKIDEWTLQQREDIREPTHHGHRRLLRERSHRDSSSDEDSSSIFEHGWSPPTLTATSFTPPSTPPLEYLDHDLARGSLSRRNTHSSRPLHTRRYSSYRDGGAHIILEPGHSSRHHHHHHHPSSSHSRTRSRRATEIMPPSPSTRPLLHHSTTWQPSSGRDVVDYPDFPLAERTIRMIPRQQHADEYERGISSGGGVYAEYGRRLKYDARPRTRASYQRRDSGYGGEREWDDIGGRGERLVVLEDGRGRRRRSGYVI